MSPVGLDAIKNPCALGWKKNLINLINLSFRAPPYIGARKWVVCVYVKCRNMCTARNNNSAAPPQWWVWLTDAAQKQVPRAFIFTSIICARLALRMGFVFYGYAGFSVLCAENIAIYNMHNLFIVYWVIFNTRVYRRLLNKFKSFFFHLNIIFLHSENIQNKDIFHSRYTRYTRINLLNNPKEENLITQSWREKKSAVTLKKI